MSADRLKKQAKNAQRHLPKFFEQHPPPYSLAESQELIARLHGYPSWRTALAAQHAKSSPGDDPIAAFYGYDWRQSSLAHCDGLDAPETCRVIETTASPAKTLDLLQAMGRSQPRRQNAVVVINSAGDAGGQVIDQIADQDELVRHFGISSFTNLSHRIGATINPIGGFPAALVSRLFDSLLAPITSMQQRECCQQALRLVLSQEAAAGRDLLEVQAAIDRLVCLSLGGWSKDDEDFYETFPDEDRHDAAHDFLARYGDKIPGLVRPLDALLTRLTAPGLDSAFNPRRCEAVGQWRDEVFDLSGPPSLAEFRGLQMITVDFGSEVLNHLAALLVLAKLKFASRFHRGLFLSTEVPPTIEVIWMRGDPGASDQ